MLTHLRVVSPRRVHRAVVLALILGVAARTHAQSASTAARDTQPASDRATLVIFASASAREVKFAKQPQISVRLLGAVTDSVHIIERRNLPDPVQPGVTYRDVYIAVEIMGHLNARCLAARITGTAGDSLSNANCASLGIRDSSSVAQPRRPPS